MRSEQIERYARHLVLKEIGGSGQAALLDAKVVIVGAGGLGGPVGLYLAAAGIGNIRIIDNDIVEVSNLQRQIQFSTIDTGKPKATLLAKKLNTLNSDANAQGVVQRLDISNAKTLLDGFDIIIDGVDDFETRFIINDAALTLGIPLVSGALGRFNGQVSVFQSDGTGPCYRCLVPAIPPDAETCSQVGVVGALAGIVGSMMALEVIKLISEAGDTLSGKLWLFDGLKSESRTIRLPRDPDCPACKAR